MDFSYNNYNNFSTQHASPSGRTPAPINYTHNCYPYKPCSYCSNPYHSSSNCPSWGRDSKFSYDQMNTNFSSLGFESNSNVYNSDWRNHPNFSWQAQAMGNCAPQYHDLHHPEYSQFTLISPTQGLIQIPVFTTRTGATILISHGKIKPQEIMLPHTMNCIILNIRSSKTKSSILHHMIPFLKNYHWKKHSKHSYRQATEICKSLRVSP
jgi:hypothetical protein